MDRYCHSPCVSITASNGCSSPRHDSNSCQHGSQVDKAAAEVLVIGQRQAYDEEFGTTGPPSGRRCGDKPTASVPKRCTAAHRGNLGSCRNARSTSSPEPMRRGRCSSLSANQDRGWHRLAHREERTLPRLHPGNRQRRISRSPKPPPSMTIRSWAYAGKNPAPSVAVN